MRARATFLPSLRRAAGKNVTSTLAATFVGEMTMMNVATLTLGASQPVEMKPKDFEALVQRHQATVWMAAYAQLGDAALSEEVAQEAFLLAWQKWPTDGTAPSLPGWFCGMARNLARNARRKEKRSGDTELEKVAGTGDPLEAALEAERRALCWDEVERLPSKLRMALLLHYGAEQSVEQMAETLEISASAAKKRLQRAREQLGDKVRRRVGDGLKRRVPATAFTAGVMAALTPRAAYAAPASSAGGWLALAAAAMVSIGAAAMWVTGPGVPATMPHEGSSVAPMAAMSSEPRAAKPTPSSRRGTARATHRPSPWYLAHAGPAAPTADTDEGVSPKMWAMLSRRVDIEVKDLPIDAFLKVVSEVAEVNIFLDREVKGTVTFAVKNATLMDALDEAAEQAGAHWRELPMVSVHEGSGPRGAYLEGPNVTAELKETALRDALETLIGMADAKLVVDEDVAEHPLSASWRDVPLGTALDGLIDGAGVHYETLPAIELELAEDR